MTSAIRSGCATAVKWAFCLGAPTLCFTLARALSTRVDGFVKNYPHPLKGVLLLSSAFLCKTVNHSSWKTALTASAVFYLCIGFVRKEKRGSWKVSSQMDVARNSQQNCVYAELEENEQLHLRIGFISWMSQWVKNKTISLPFKGFAWESLQLQTKDNSLTFSGYKKSSILWSIRLLNDGSIEHEMDSSNVDRYIGLLIGQFMTIQACFRNQKMNPQIYANRMGDVFDEWCNNIFTENTLLREPVKLFNGAIGGPSNYVSQQFEQGPDGPKVTFQLKVLGSQDRTGTFWRCIVKKGDQPNSWILRSDYSLILQSDWILHKTDENWYIQLGSNGDSIALSQTFLDEENQEGSYVAAVAQLLLDPYTVITINNKDQYQVNGTLKLPQRR